MAAGEGLLAEAAAEAAAASAKYFFDEVKAKSGVAKLLEVEMMSLQLTFTNNVLRSVHSRVQGVEDENEVRCVKKVESRQRVDSDFDTC